MPPRACAQQTVEETEAAHASRAGSDQARYQRLFDELPVGMFRARGDGRLTDGNVALVRMLGLPNREALLAMNVTRLFAAGQDGRLWRELIDRRGVLSGVELPLQRADAARIWVRVHARAARDAGGVVSYEGMVEDVTERKRAEELALKQAHVEEERRAADAARVQLQADLERAAREWTLTFDTLATAIVVLDAGGRVLRLNRAALELARVAGYEDVIGRRPDELSAREPWRGVAELLRRARAGGRAVAELNDGVSGTTWLASLGPMSGVDDGEERYLLTVRDLTEIVMLQEALGRSQAMATMGSLVAGVAHEVRNPLFSISASLDALERHFGSAIAARPFATVLRRSVQRLNDLMTELLEYGRPQASLLVPGSLPAVIAEAIESCQAQALEAGVTVLDRSAAGLPLVAMDRGRLLLVFRNLVENALHHSPTGGAIRLEAALLHEPDGPVVECRVRDAGSGFREEDLPRVFEPFYTRRRGGTGLGLAIAQRIVQQHHGTIAASNHRLGGAVVSVRLPVGGAVL